MCVEVSLARNEPSVRGGQSLTSWRLRTRLGRELSLVCVEVSLARNESSVRGGQSLTKTIGIKVCVSFCHRISVTDFCHRISVTRSP